MILIEHQDQPALYILMIETYKEHPSPCIPSMYSEHPHNLEVYKTAPDWWFLAPGSTFALGHRGSNFPPEAPNIPIPSALTIQPCPMNVVHGSSNIRGKCITS